MATDAMTPQQRVHAHFRASIEVKIRSAEALAPLIAAGAELLTRCLRAGGKKSSPR